MAKELVTFLDIHNSVFEKTNMNASSADASNMVNRIINEKYIDVAQIGRWRWLLAAGATTIPQVYSTGLVTIGAGSATIIGNASVSFGASVVGRKVFLTSQNELYTISSRSSATRLILTENYAGTALSGVSYKIFQDTYRLPADCEEVVDVYHNPPSGPRVIKGIDKRTLFNLRSRSLDTNNYANFWTHDIETSSGTRTIGIYPSGRDDKQYKLRYEYIKRPTSLAATNDKPLMPVSYRSVLMWSTVSDIFMTQGNMTRARWAENMYQTKLREMRKDWEVTDRRPRLKVAGNYGRRGRLSPARYDLGSAWENDEWDN